MNYYCGSTLLNWFLMGLWPKTCPLSGHEEIETMNYAHVEMLNGIDGDGCIWVYRNWKDKNSPEVISNCISTKKRILVLDSIEPFHPFIQASHLSAQQTLWSRQARFCIEKLTRQMATLRTYCVHCYLIWYSFSKLYVLWVAFKNKLWCGFYIKARLDDSHMFV